MALPHQRAANREREAAKILKSERFIRKDPKKRAPDVVPIRLPNGDVIQPEVKNGMKRCPRVLVKALEQAASYTRGCIPLAVFSDVGGEAIGCMPLKDLSRLLGIQPEKLNKQLVFSFHETVSPVSQQTVSPVYHEDTQPTVSPVDHEVAQPTVSPVDHEEQLECIDKSTRCFGQVTMRDPGCGSTLYPRCAKHGEDRVAQHNKENL